MITWPGGFGKSRIMVSIGMLALMTNPGCKKVKFVYTNNLLMQKDIDDYEDLWKLLGLE